MPQKERVVATELPVDLIFKFETLLITGPSPVTWQHSKSDAWGECSRLGRNI